MADRTQRTSGLQTHTAEQQRLKANFEELERLIDEKEKQLSEQEHLIYSLASMAMSQRKHWENEHGNTLDELLRANDVTHMTMVELLFAIDIAWEVAIEAGCNMYCKDRASDKALQQALSDMNGTVQAQDGKQKENKSGAGNDDAEMQPAGDVGEEDQNTHKGDVEAKAL